MKKVFVLSIFMITVLILIGCGAVEKTYDKSMFDDKDTLIGFSALSSVMTLENNLKDSTMYQSKFKNLSQHIPDDTFAILSEIDDLTPYLDLVSTFMGGGNNFQVEVTSSNHDDYEHEMVITTIDMEGESISYTLYYNETFEDDDADIDPEEYDSVIEGIMIIDEVIYMLYGERQIDEGEESLEFTAKIDDENYVTLDYEIEIEAEERSIEFDYEMYKDDHLVMSIEIQFQEDAEETELSLKFIRGNRESEYDFEIEIDGDKRTIEIEYKITEDGNVIEEGEAEVKITFDAETNQYVVRYKIETKGETVTIDTEYKNTR